MSLFKSIVSALALLVAPLATLSPAAFAQGTKVVTMDTARVLAESAAGQDIQQKIATIGSTMATELEPQRLTVESGFQEVAPITEGKTPQQLEADMAADPALAQKVALYANNLQRYQAGMQRANQELELTRRAAFVEFRKALQPVVQSVFETSGADLLLEREEVIYAAASLDVTDQIIAKMNEVAPTVDVVRQTLPQQGQAE